MLAYILALAVGFCSLAIYIGAFFFPEIHRKSDFYWSGVGLFYALVLWVCAGRITGGVLLGQLASVALLGWFAWQTVTLRYALTPASQRTNIASPESSQDSIKVSTPSRITSIFSDIKDKAGKTFGGITKRQGKSDIENIPKPLTYDAVKEAIADADQAEVVSQPVTETTKIEPPPTQDSPVVEPVHPNPPPAEIVVNAIIDAEKKGIPSEPPITEEEVTGAYLAPTQEPEAKTTEVIIDATPASAPEASTSPTSVNSAPATIDTTTASSPPTTSSTQSLPENEPKPENPPNSNLVE